MKELGSPTLEGLGSTVRRKRSRIFRRPKLEASPVHDESPLSSAPHSDSVSQVSSNDNTGGGTNSRRKEFSLNQCVLRDSSSIGCALDHMRSSGGVLAPGNRKCTSKRKNSSEFLSGDNEDAAGIDNRVKKVKLKVGGVTHMIQTKSNLNGVSGPRTQHKEDSSGEGHFSLHKNAGLRGIPWKDFTVTNSGGEKEDFMMRKVSGKTGSDRSRKNKRVPKKRVLDEASEDDEDAEIKFLEKVKNSKVSVLNKGSMDTDNEEGEELVAGGEAEGKKMKNSIKDSIDSTMESKRESALTTRRRALLSGKNGSRSNGIEFPNGLPPAPPRKQKEKLTEAEQLLKKTEAAQRRRLQVEKAARESEAEAIRKILGQDSSRKKREDKNKKRQEELEQEKAATALKLASNTVRWVMGPSGTVVTFPNEMGLPSIFNPSTRSYPPPREKCAGPSCNNPYKYRDSKTKLPLCSLQCYKAVQPPVPLS